MGGYDSVVGYVRWETACEAQYVLTKKGVLGNKEPTDANILCASWTVGWVLSGERHM